MQEIERKFSVKNTNFLANAKIWFNIKQGYLNSDKNRTVRIRTKNNKGFITVKGKSSLDGLSRFEWEKEILIDDAERLLLLCEDFIIDKTRYIVDFNGKEFEVDVFQGDNKGLIIAEVELNSVDEEIDLPDWIDMELTGDPRYYNAYISTNTYNKW
jgi:adenylate cyclase